MFQKDGDPVTSHDARRWFNNNAMNILTKKTFYEVLFKALLIRYENMTKVANKHNLCHKAFNVYGTLKLPLTCEVVDIHIWKYWPKLPYFPLEIWDTHKMNFTTFETHKK